ncbi:hypothetical protein KRR39_03885 [Nocardioides panacis]|uniref:Peptidase n=1 Tax=Nocardioides panacis TaxID=2849501 RepID=A0A975T050_9ACTN|nr:hypothetical protein [Nocardioides panacis]QWZ08982.1 hypothetical protein KRR39_03885 [Nocardioides panacis]
MSSRARRTRLAALLLLVMAAGTAPAASADDGLLLIDVPGDGTGFVHDTDSPLLRFGELAPGYSTSGTLELRNDSTRRAGLRLRSFDVEESENGCVRPERNDGDVTCTGEGGELADWLEVEVGQVTPEGGRSLWQGSLTELDGPGAGVALASLGAGEVLPLRVTVTMRRDAGNDTMTDAVGFGLRWSAQTDSRESRAEVLGVAAYAPTGGSPAPATGLPLVGRAIPVWLALADLAVLLGGGVVVLAVRRRRPAAPA